MTDPYQAFRINSSNGVISVRNSSLLDYEILKTNPFNLLVSFVLKFSAFLGIKGFTPIFSSPESKAHKVSL